VASKLSQNTAALRVHACVTASRVNGPGLRGVLWLQGCTLGCPGCFNPETHARTGGEEWAIKHALDWASSLPQDVTGITISGGEPLQQIAPLTSFLTGVRQATPLSIIVFTGFDLAEVQLFPGNQALLENIDVLIAGRYMQAQRVSRALVGSANKTMHFLSGRHTVEDFLDIPEAEITVSSNGEISFSGIDPLSWG
jgi:anaerobic ribonucleoside-triphosphate reductase activating protein